MAMHPDMLAKLANEHQRELRYEADYQRLAQQVSGGQSEGSGEWLLRRASAALVAASRALKPRKRSQAGVPDVPPTLAAN